MVELLDFPYRLHPVPGKVEIIHHELGLDNMLNDNTYEFYGLKVRIPLGMYYYVGGSPAVQRFLYGRFWFLEQLILISYILVLQRFR